MGVKGQVAAVVSLGCAKNTVDSEVILGLLSRAGYRLSDSLEDCDLIVVNTCGFIESAVRENIDCILDLAEYKNNGRLQKLVVVGCLVQRYQAELIKILPEVDIFLPASEVGRIDRILAKSSSSLRSNWKAEPYLYDDLAPRILSGGKGSAYVKIAEGCNRSCAFCTIPMLRGRYRSRELASVVREVKKMGESGVVEVNLVAQDTTAFGSDHKKCQLSDLLEVIDKEGGVRWQRVLYAYPTGISQQLLEVMVGLPSVCKYLDLPLQHVSDRILGLMHRPVGRYGSRRIVEFIKKYAPELGLRTTLIVGFPGETEGELRELERFVSEGYFSSLGVFPYSAEKGTAAFGLSDQLSAEEKDERVKLIMMAQKRVNDRVLKLCVGQKLEVILEGYHPESELLLQARTRFQAPEVDGVVIINELEDDSSEPVFGRLYQAEITDAVGYDLLGRLITIRAA